MMFNASMMPINAYSFLKSFLKLATSSYSGDWVSEESFYTNLGQQNAGLFRRVQDDTTSRGLVDCNQPDTEVSGDADVKLASQSDFANVSEARYSGSQIQSRGPPACIHDDNHMAAVVNTAQSNTSPSFVALPKCPVMMPFLQCIFGMLPSFLQFIFGTFPLFEKKVRCQHWQAIPAEPDPKDHSLLILHWLQSFLPLSHCCFSYGGAAYFICCYLPWILVSLLVLWRACGFFFIQSSLAWFQSPPPPAPNPVTSNLSHVFSQHWQQLLFLRFPSHFPSFSSNPALQGSATGSSLGRIRCNYRQPYCFLQLPGLLPYHDLPLTIYRLAVSFSKLVA